MTSMNLNSLTPRIAQHKHRLVEIISPPVCTERALHYTQAYQQHMDQPMVVRRAYALAHHLKSRTIWIDNDELIIGNQGAGLRAAPIFPEYTMDWVVNEIDILADRPGAGFSVSAQDKAIVNEIAPFWKGQTVKDRCFALFSQEHKDLLSSGIIKAEGNMNAGDAHMAVDYESVLQKGIKHVIARVVERRQRIDQTDWADLHKDQFLKAVEMTMHAMSEHILRYAAVARQDAAAESRDWRRQELIQIAENCEWIATEPPKTFWQALQLCFFIQLFLQIESNGHSVSFGRLDQYLYPWYRRDVELEQTLTREKAIELLQSCWLKLLEVNKIRSTLHSKSSAGSPMYQNVTIGGQKLVNGVAMDAVNPLSYAILESCGQLKSTQPNLSVRYHAGLSSDFMQACLDVIRCGFGMPAFNNDEIVIPEFIKLGVEKEDAYNYSAIGCIETAVPGKWGYRCTGMSFLNFTRVMLATLEQGKDATTGQVFLPHQKGLSLGNFNRFDEVMQEWDRQVRHYTRRSVEIDTIIDAMLEENAHDILCSALIDDCIERGLTAKQGGAKYDWISGLQVGIANTGNSLAAIRDFVFGGKLSQQEMANYLANDFAGDEGEIIRQMLLNRVAKYGNDDDSVDLLLVDAYQSYIDEIGKYHNTRFGRGPIGGGYYAGTSSISANVPFGAGTMATPDGRKSGTPLAEGASPSSGTDSHGPTAVFNSLGKLPTEAILGGVLLNQKLNPTSLEQISDREKLITLMRTFFEIHHGWHVQYNIVSRETLLAAKAHPDQYRDLVVRVAGYSAFFTALSPDTQDDIIARTEHSLS